MNTSELFKIGYISKTHGLKGEVTALLDHDVDLTDHPVLMIELKGGLIPYSIEKISGQPLKPFLKLEGIDSLDRAASLKGGSLYIAKTDRSKLKRGEFYDDEVAGFYVHDKSLGDLGIVREVQNHGANRLLVILHGTKELLVPVNGPFIKSVNKTKKVIQLDLPDGFLEF
jgi:16S rRNA processing protein RimM